MNEEIFRTIRTFSIHWLFATKFWSPTYFLIVISLIPESSLFCKTFTVALIPVPVLDFLFSSPMQVPFGELTDLAFLDSLFRTSVLETFFSIFSALLFKASAVQYPLYFFFSLSFVVFCFLFVIFFLFLVVLSGFLGDC